jgi:WD40 repeat protein
VTAAGDGKWVAWGAVDGKVAVVGLYSRTVCNRERHADTANSVSLDTMASRLASSSKDGEVRVWDVRSGRVTQRLRTAADLRVPSALSPDGRLVVAVGAGGLHFWDATSGRLLEHVGDPADESDSDDVSFRPDGVLLVIGGPRGFVVWDVARRTPHCPLPAAGDTGTRSPSVSSLVVHPPIWPEAYPLRRTSP